MFFACLAALCAQFYPMPFPSSIPLLIVCCAIYFIISMILTAIVTFIDKDTIILTRPNKVVLNHFILSRKEEAPEIILNYFYYVTFQEIRIWDANQSQVWEISGVLRHEHTIQRSNLALHIGQNVCREVFHRQGRVRRGNDALDTL